MTKNKYYTIDAGTRLFQNSVKRKALNFNDTY